MRDLQSQLLTGRMAEVALEYARGTRTPSEPRPASTVVLLRTPPTTPAAAALAAHPAPEVYLLRRQRTMAFAAGMTVFPGGRVDPTDSTVADSWFGPAPGWFGERLRCSAEAAAAYVAAAVRETFEESGVLLAGPTPDAVVEDTTGAGWEADRVALETRELGFADFLHRRELLLRADLLGPWAHWITPEFEPKRYDTAFFVAALPAGQVTRDVTSESDQVTWIRPADAVTAVDAGDMLMLPPTYVCCHDLSRYRDVPAILAAAGEREIRAIMPTVRVDGDQAYLETS
ncbi:8-oxo-dGTP pyrophosphatase MutT (NUDIX family) [Kribbella aluminosa]|uniref:8-oxo-dGTP pyrophosphatase MutT (NUDIX family) n=1 Tax=Kribbella aluminosa TaxID=416017 RepID=A0ABS4URQ1_9ACTN|nr:NUDIX hydrolase [Kribbella aluminosa]MBP2354318.1 8-oxo-dGTP pyrophosphatase MutT (NUDIX family) [Kribbella aluminosa]